MQMIMKRKTTMLITLMSVITFCTSAQSVFFRPPGEKVKSVTIHYAPYGPKSYVLIDQKHVVIKSIMNMQVESEIYTPPPGVDIVHVRKKVESYNAVLI